MAEAFHWFAHERALAEIARVLGPSGLLVLMWNRPAGQVQPSISAVEQLLQPYWPKDIEMPLDLNPNRLPHARDWPRVFAHSVFEPLHESVFAKSTSCRPRRVGRILRFNGLDRCSPGRRMPDPARRGEIAATREQVHAVIRDACSHDATRRWCQTAAVIEAVDPGSHSTVRSSIEATNCRSARLREWRSPASRRSWLRGGAQRWVHPGGAPFAWYQSDSGMILQGRPTRPRPAMSPAGEGSPLAAETPIP